MGEVDAKTRRVEVTEAEIREAVTLAQTYGGPTVAAILRTGTSPKIVTLALGFMAAATEMELTAALASDREARAKGLTEEQAVRFIQTVGDGMLHFARELLRAMPAPPKPSPPVAPLGRHAAVAPADRNRRGRGRGRPS